MFESDPFDSADGSLDERAGGDFTFQTLLGDFIRNPDPASDENIHADRHAEMDMVMCDNTMFHAQTSSELEAWRLQARSGLEIVCVLCYLRGQLAL